jgi:hypothetical protein
MAATYSAADYFWSGLNLARVVLDDTAMNSIEGNPAVADASVWYGFHERYLGRTAARTARRKGVWRDVLSFCTDILALRAWRRKDPVACFMLSAYVAIMVQPVLYGSLGQSIVALMTPVK